MENFKIAQNYKILHFDEYPILFIGVNHQNKIIVGSFKYEDNDENLLYFHLLVHNELAIDFLEGKLSYLELLRQASEIAIVKKDYNENILEIKPIKFQDIDSADLPFSNAFCPTVERKVIRVFQIYSQEFSSNKFQSNRHHRSKSKFAFSGEVGKDWLTKTRRRTSHSLKLYKLPVNDYRSNQPNSSHFKPTLKQLQNS